MNWKSWIVGLTEGEAARAARIDSTLFPPLLVETLEAWETKTGQVLPPLLREFLLVSNGLEAQSGQLHPILPFEHWSYWDDACASAVPIVKIGSSPTHDYQLLLGGKNTFYRNEKYGSSDEFFAPNLKRYLELFFSDRA